MKKMSSIVVVAEGAAKGSDVVDYIRDHTYLNPNLTVLGYVQRGGSPSALDVIMAGLFSQKAIDSLLAGTYNCVIGLIDSKVVATPYSEADKLHYSIDENMFNLVHLLGR